MTQVNETAVRGGTVLEVAHFTAPTPLHFTSCKIRISASGLFIS
jgi:hypothetical protein